MDDCNNKYNYVTHKKQLNKGILWNLFTSPNLKLQHFRRLKVMMQIMEEKNREIKNSRLPIKIKMLMKFLKEILMFRVFFVYLNVITTV